MLVKDKFLKWFIFLNNLRLYWNYYRYILLSDVRVWWGNEKVFVGYYVRYVFVFL